MNCCIHRGAHEIGGNCVELELEGQSILLDFGQPLDAAMAVPARKFQSKARLLGAFISHAHLDHYGYLPQLSPEVPVYMGTATRRLLEAASRFSAHPVGLPDTLPLQAGRPTEVGPFRVTPYLVDHSAYDAYAFLVEGGGKRLFYSADLRAHGRKGRTFEALVASGPRRVDAMLLEGTTLGREDSASRPRTEAEVEAAIADTFKGTQGLALAMFSGQNIDRLVTVYRAARRAGRTLVMDLYQAHLIEALENAKLPNPGWGRSRVRVFVPYAQRKRLEANGHQNLLERYQSVRIGERELARRAHQFVATFRTSWRPDLERGACLKGARLIYSMWPGYLQQPESDWAAWCAARDIEIVHHHTSGHAHPADLQRLVNALAPAQVVPIHTLAAARYTEVFPRVTLRADGVWWAL